MEYFPAVQSRFQALHKTNSLGNNRQTRINNLKTTRKNMRNQEIDEHRNFDEPILKQNNVGKRNEQKDRKVLLKEWKKIKEQKLKNEKLSKKPIFKVGAVNNVGFPQISLDFAPKNNVFKPPKNIQAINFKEKTIPTVSKNPLQRVTRSQKPIASPPLPLPLRQKKSSASTSSKKNLIEENKKVNNLFNKHNLLKKTPKTSSKQKLTKKREQGIDKNIDIEENVNSYKPTKGSKRKRLSRKKSDVFIEEPIESQATLEKLNTSTRKEKQSINNILSTDTDEEKEYTEFKRNTRRSTRKSLSNIENLELNSNNLESFEKETINSRKSIRRSKRKSITIKENLNCNQDENENNKTPLNNKILNNVTPENQRVYISPFVTTSRGKKSMKKENLERSLRGLPSFTKHTSLDETINSKIISAGTDYFFTVLNNEILRLKDLCRIWTDYKESETISDCSQDMIDVAVGQANLLMTKKFKQFEGLIKACQTGIGADKPVTCEDLQGFWDMIYIQVENLNGRFNRLTELKNNNWEEFLPVVKSKVVKKRTKAITTKSSASSGIRAAIQAARQKKKQSKLNLAAEPENESVFNGEFCRVRSPYKKTPSKVISKPTPKSILKSQKKRSLNKSLNKVVLFKNEDSE